MSRDEPMHVVLDRNDPTQRELLNAVYDYVTDKDGREKTAEQRSAALIRVHEAGWRNTAAAIKQGLGDIAEAIRSRR